MKSRREYSVYYGDSLVATKKRIDHAQSLIRKIHGWDRHTEQWMFHVWTTDDQGDPLKLRVNNEWELEDMSWVTFTIPKKTK